MITNDGRTVQVVLEFSDNLPETAHPSYFANIVVLDARDPSPVTLDRVSKSDRRAYITLANQVSKVAGEVDEQGLRPVRANWIASQTTPAGMVFRFQDYQLGGHSLRTSVVPCVLGDGVADVVSFVFPASGAKHPLQKWATRDETIQALAQARFGP